MFLSKTIASVTLATLLGLGAAAPAGAAIRCDGSFQINSQGEFGSMYCREDNLAKVARERGIHVTAAQIRASIGVEQQVCQQLSSDIRVSDICGQWEHHHNCNIMFPC
jgi:hypothetical protein